MGEKQYVGFLKEACFGNHCSGLFSKIVPPLLQPSLGTSSQQWNVTSRGTFHSGKGMVGIALIHPCSERWGQFSSHW